jgi:hypothetical protein
VSPAVTAASLAQAFGESAHFADRAGLGSAAQAGRCSPRRAERLGELAAEGLGGGEFGAGCGDLRQFGAVGAGEVVGRGRRAGWGSATFWPQALAEAEEQRCPVASWRWSGGGPA